MSKDKKDINELFDKLKAGIKALYQDNKKYLDFLSSNTRYRHYSGNNQIYLWMQCQSKGVQGHYLNTFKGWKDLGFSVNKGEKALSIICPSTHKYFQNEKGVWKSLKSASKEELSKIKSGKLDVKALTSFYTKNSLFDIKQTNCPEEEYKKLIYEKLMPKGLKENHDKKVDFLFFSLKKKHLVENENLKVEFEDLESDLKGYVNRDNKIGLNNKNTNMQNLKTLIHEYTHYKLHISQKTELKKYQKEIEAESTAYLVCQNFDIDTSEYSFKYITSYGNSRTEEELYNSYENIITTANQIDKVLEAALALEIINTLEKGDIVQVNDSNTEEVNSQPVFIIDKQGEQYEAFKITSDEEPYITNVKMEKDASNNLSKDSYIQMGTRYLIDKNDITNKLGHASNLEKLNGYMKLFESKGLTQKVSPQPIAQKVENAISMSHELSFKR